MLKHQVEFTSESNIQMVFGMQRQERASAGILRVIILYTEKVNAVIYMNGGDHVLYNREHVQYRSNPQCRVLNVNLTTLTSSRSNTRRP